MTQYSLFIGKGHPYVADSSQVWRAPFCPRKHRTPLPFEHRSSFRLPNIKSALSENSEMGANSRDFL
jgi:hypothetical protein